MFRLKKTIGFAALLVLAGMISAGCNMFKVKPAPPAYSLWQHKKMMIVPFQNITQDVNSAKEIQDPDVRR